MPFIDETPRIIKGDRTSVLDVLGPAINGRKGLSIFLLGEFRNRMIKLRFGHKL